MVWRWTALVGLAAVLAPLSAMATDAKGSPLGDAVFMEWSGVVEETVLSDNSVLSEYIAYTRSRKIPGAMLQVAFVPRFECSPLLRIIVPERGDQDPPERAFARLSIDGEVFDFPSLIDSDSVVREYAFLAEHARQQQLREVLDRSSRLQVQWTDAADNQAVLASPDDEAETLEFSLLGSRLSVEAVEARCQTHTPLEFKLTESD